MGTSLTIYIENYESDFRRMTKIKTDRSTNFYNDLLSMESSLSDKIRGVDAYGRTLKYITAAQFNGRKFTSFLYINAAAIAYISQLPDETKIYLYWH